jgi:hypothetical protein
MTSASLYEGILGPAWSSIAESVRSLHSDAGRTRITGQMQVHAAQSTAGRFLCAVGGLPRSSGIVGGDLIVEASPTVERWHRSIGAWRSESVQTANEGLLTERIGMLDLGFVLSEDSGGIRYTQTSAHLSFFGLRFPLPRFAAPRVAVLERPASDGRTVIVDVALSVPLVGTILRYVGSVARSSA